MNKTVVLEWSTATETNNKGFEVQKKFVFRGWEVIGFVSGSGTTTETRDYNFSDDLLSEGIYSYRLKQIDFDGSYEYSSEVNIEVSFPNEFNLAQNYPNPFNPSTVIEFSLPENAGNVQLLIYNALGEKVAELLNTELATGIHAYDWNASGMVSGMYFYELRTEKFSSVKKMLLLK